MSASVTIKDVAKMAGVSIATVSKVMNGTGNVDAALCQRVREAANALGYKRNQIARLLKTAATNHVHIILPNLTDENYRSVYAGAEQVLNDHGYLVSLHLTSEIRYRENQHLESALQQRAAGVILATCQPDDGTRVADLDKANAKLVFIEREPAYARYPFFEFDNRRLIQAAVEKLLQSGCRSLVLLAGPKEYTSESQAVKGFTEAVNGTGAEAVVLESNLTAESSFVVMVNHLHAGFQPDAVITTSMVTYKSVRKAAEIVGQSLARPVRFVTTGHAGWADVIPEGTEIIARNSYKLGEEAARALIDQINNTVASDGRYHCIHPEMPASMPHGPSPSLRIAKKSGCLRLLLQVNAMPSIEPLLTDFEKRTGWKCVIDPFYYDDMFDVFDNPDKLAEYDILQIDQPVFAELARSGILARLDGMLDRLPELPEIGGERVSALDSYSRFDGSVYAVPFRFGSQLLFYRSDLFDNPDVRMQFRRATGGELRPPETWEEFNRVAEFFTRSRNPDSPVEYGHSMGSHHYIGVASEFMPRVWSFGGNAVDADGRIVIDQREGLDALRNYLESHRYASPDSRENWLDGQIRTFNAGQTAMMVIFSAMAEHLIHRNESQVVGKVAFAQLPGKTPLLGGWSLGVRNGTPNMQAAVEWIRWITSDRIAMPHTVLGGASMAVMLSENSELRSIYPWLSMALDSFRISRPHEVSGVSTGGSIRFREFFMAISQCVHEALDGKISAEQAMEKAAALIKGGRHASGLNTGLMHDADYIAPIMSLSERR